MTQTANVVKLEDCRHAVLLYFCTILESRAFRSSSLKYHLPVAVTVICYDTDGTSDSTCMYKPFLTVLHCCCMFYGQFFSRMSYQSLTYITLLVVKLSYAIVVWCGDLEIICGHLEQTPSLPLDIRSAPALSTFKNMLKTHLFSLLLLH